MAGIMDTIKNAVSGNKQQTTQTTPPASGITSGANATVDNSGQVNSGDANKAANPLDAFKNMYDTSTTQEDKAPSFTLPKDKLSQVAQSMDFTKGIDPAVMQKAMSGDAASFMEVIQHTGRAAYEASLEHSSGLTDQYVNSRLEHDSKSFGSKVKAELTQNELGTTANFNHPVVKQQLTDTARLLSKQHPDASPQEIATMARNYVTTLAQAINPNFGDTGNASNKQTAQETNWDDYFSKG